MVNIPCDDNAEKPPPVAGVEWVRKGAGWDCKLVWYEGQARKRRHVRHLGKKQWEEIRQHYQGRELLDYMGRWVREQIREKGIEVAA